MTLPCFPLADISIGTRSAGCLFGKVTTTLKVMIMGVNHEKCNFQRLNDVTRFAGGCGVF